MGKKLASITGMTKSDFDQIVLEAKEIKLRSARLIPLIKPGDEMALTSIFLSSLRLIKEFRKDILNAVNLISSGRIYVYTEIEFSQFKENRVDGLIIVVKGGKIKDAALLEMKNKSDELAVDQIQRYLEIAKLYKIPKLITVSNQFVSVPTQSPIYIKPPKNVVLYHLSWSYILTIARILLFENDKDIKDEDQVEIMREVVSYLEHSASGVCGFSQMKLGWKNVVQKINAGENLKSDDKDVDDTVVSWLQEERDMALILSRRLGLLVRSGESKYKNNLPARLENDTENLVNNKKLISTLRVEGAVSNIVVNANFDRRNIEMSVVLNTPQDRKTRGQLGWLKGQFKNCKSRNEELLNSLKNELRIEVAMKYSSTPERLLIDDLDEIIDKIKDKEIKEFRIIQIKDLGRKFESRSGFVQTIEYMLLDYYEGIVQHLKKWEKPAPKMPPKTNADSSAIETNE
jgi:hypothetical protein